MASLRNVLRNALPSMKQFDTKEGKENKGYVGTPHTKRTDTLKSGQSKSAKMASGKGDNFKRNVSVSQSMRDVVGTFRQKLKKSTRQRKRLEEAPKSPLTPASRYRRRNNKKTPTKRGGYREVRMYSPFTIETPKTRTPLSIKTRATAWHGMETPTRLRREVEDLTANMQALVNLTPRTLQTRAASRRSLHASPITNGTLKTPKSNRRVTIGTRRRSERITEI